MTFSEFIKFIAYFIFFTVLAYPPSKISFDESAKLCLNTKLGNIYSYKCSKYSWLVFVIRRVIEKNMKISTFSKNVKKACFFKKRGTSPGFAKINFHHLCASSVRTNRFIKWRFSSPRNNVQSRENRKTRKMTPQKRHLGHFLTSDVIRQIRTFLSWANRLRGLMKSFWLGRTVSEIGFTFSETTLCV